MNKMKLFENFSLHYAYGEFLLGSPTCAVMKIK